jgi:hypothetical protein
VLFKYNIQSKLFTIALIKINIYKKVTNIKASKLLPRPKYRYLDYKIKLDNKQSNYVAYSLF